MNAPAEESLVFNVVWTGGVFTYLRYFVASQMICSDARFRFVANGCAPGQLELIHAFATKHPDRVLEVFESSTTMEPHGAALDRVLSARDDGDHFCFIDADILAKARFLPAFVERLEQGCAAVTSGRVFWRQEHEDDVLPAGSVILPGDFFYGRDGYVFGSPHFAMYRRGLLDETIARWDIGFASAGPDVTDAVRKKLTEIGHQYVLYDTGKIVNILLQEDGHKLCHFEHPDLLHIGGLSHYLCPPDDERDVKSSAWAWPDSRLKVAWFTAAVLRDACEGRRPVAGVPGDLEPSMAERMRIVREELIALVRDYEPYVLR